jgi:hypothetical protein
MTGERLQTSPWCFLPGPVEPLVVMDTGRLCLHIGHKNSPVSTCGSPVLLPRGRDPLARYSEPLHAACLLDLPAADANWWVSEGASALSEAALRTGRYNTRRSAGHRPPRGHPDRCIGHSRSWAPRAVADGRPVCAP